jgi:hypothetical protein
MRKKILTYHILGEFLCNKKLTYVPGHVLHHAAQVPQENWILRRKSRTGGYVMALMLSFIHWKYNIFMLEARVGLELHTLGSGFLA